jgi:hypothetical protein
LNHNAGLSGFSRRCSSSFKSNVIHLWGNKKQQRQQQHMSTACSSQDAAWSGFSEMPRLSATSSTGSSSSMRHPQEYQHNNSM